MVLFDNLEDIFQNWRNFNEYSRALVTLATAIGTLTILIFFFKFVLEAIQGLRLYIYHQCCCSNRNFRQRYGQWAIISGSTDGIGLAMAKELARDGHSIIVVGRNDEKLANTKASLESEANVGEVMTVKIDLADQSPENYERIRRQIDPDNRDIGILINNAGVFSGIFTRYNNRDMDMIRESVNVNIMATLYFTRMIMPGMLHRGKGLVVNVSSIVGSVTAPYWGVYGPTKTFMDSFSKILQAEYSSHPIDIVNLTPGGVHTKLFKDTTKMETPTLFNPTPEDYARTSLNAVSSGSPFIAGTATHALFSKGAKVFESMGLSPLGMRLNAQFNARNNNISPVMRRKRVSQVKGDDVPSASQTQ